jgi:hypothetical protein
MLNATQEKSSSQAKQAIQSKNASEQFWLNAS